ncbi:MAG: ABC transporter ATP-binding protein [Limisphaerales bacterium]
MPADADLYQLRGVGKNYAGAEGGAVVRVLRDVDLTVARGEAVALVGPSGSGKTTLLNILGTLDRADSGQVLLEGQDLGALDEAGLAAVRNRKVGFVFQSHHLLPHLTVLENVLIPTLPLEDGAVRTAAPDRARKLLARVGLGDRVGHRPGQLSGGECQRVAVVRAMINQPRILLADEPTGALDHTNARELSALLRELNREEGVTLVVVTHSSELARDMGRVLVFSEGRLREGGAA